MFNPTVALLSGVLVTGAGEASEPMTRRRTFQGSIAGTGAVAATINIEVSNEAAAGNASVSPTANWLVLGTITLSGTTAASDGFTSVSAWRFVRANVTAITGTGTAATVTMGVEK